MENRNKVRLTLYITGRSVRSTRALKNLRQICEMQQDGSYEVQVIDVLERPEEAEKSKVLATPTLIKQLPLPIRRIIGDLSDTDQVLIALGMRT